VRGGPVPANVPLALRVASGLLALQLGAVAAGASAPWSVVASAATGSGTVTGSVFHDYDADGIRDVLVAFATATDRGVAGVVVRAFDATGAEVGSATTASDGTYTLAVTDADSDQVRIEFTLPVAQPGPATYVPSTTTVTGASGSARGTTVQFVTLGDTGVDLAVHLPDEHCQASPNVAVSRQCLGDNATIALAPTLWVTRYDGGPFATAGGFSDVFVDWTATTAATHAQTFAVHGVAWDPRSGRVLASAYVRRSVSLLEIDGTPRPGALFSTTPVGTSAAGGTGGATSLLVDLETLLAGAQFSNPAPAGPGYVPTNAARGGWTTADSDIPDGSVGVYEEVGKVGIGDIDVDGDGNLWVVSLFTRELYRVALPADGSAPTTMTSVGSIVSGVSCVNGVARPFAVEHWRGALYLGVVCDGSHDYDPAAPNAPGDDANLSFSIVRYDPEAAAWSSFLGPIPLNAGGAAFKGSGIGNSPVETERWNPWTDTFSTAWIRSAAGWGHVRPVPMLTDIEFDADGSVVVGFRSRTTDQASIAYDRNYTFYSGKYPDGSANNDGSVNVGDVYRICRTGTGYTSSDYTFEGGDGCTRNYRNDPDVAVASDDEYYNDDYRTTHWDTAAGMTEQVPGFSEVLASTMDPNDTAQTGLFIGAGGLMYFRHSDGNRRRAVDGGPNPGGGVIYYHGVNPNTGPNGLGSFDKANGMGDLEALCDPAPIEIGNRVWFDANGDGIQDPGEDPLVGVTVRLYTAGGVLVGTAVTGPDGAYTFSSRVDEAASGNGDAAGGGLQPGLAYEIRLDWPADHADGGPLDGLFVTRRAALGDVGSARDSDARVSTSSGWPILAVSALRAGFNDHSGFDIGISSTPPPPDDDPVGDEDAGSGDDTDSEADAAAAPASLTPGRIPAGGGGPPRGPTVLAALLLALIVVVPIRRAAIGIGSRRRD